ncbi:branched-chain amino acid aminotransferase II [Obba rivulosa]|uniref:Branched-chain-amino-acid aminotransferase n=1 Tax=Obba rivulosa TaxID=1052685 RepID=A0A8E2DIV7_9APHY|nr:branched-chain amino acid aminotransferase II [Obba rivulosa]
MRVDEISNGSAVTSKADRKAQLAPLDASKLRITLTDALRVVPPPEEQVVGKSYTDHMLIVSYDPQTGWSDPEIKPYGPLSIDPACSVLQYGTSCFEGMKAYLGPDGKARLFRPDENMARLKRSAERLALPPFDEQEVLKLVKKLITVETRWIPALRGYSLYIRPTIIGTRPSIGVCASDHAILYVILSPTGPYFRTGSEGISLLALGDPVRSWPGGTGGHKVAPNYSPGFKSLEYAKELGYQQVLWLIGGKITEAGVMNFFAVLEREDGDLDVITPPLNGTILPGVTRASVIALAAAHPSRIILPGIPNTVCLHVHERELTMSNLTLWSAQGRLLEVFVSGTAAVVGGIGRIGFEGEDLLLHPYKDGRGPVARALFEYITDIQEGRTEWENWGVVCE